MDVFQYLRDDDRQIEERLSEVINHYWEWHRDRIFEESKKIFERIREHLHEKEALLMNNLKSVAGIEATLAELLRQRETIDGIINSTVMIHVDEPGFDKYLQSLLQVIKEHRQFCSKTYYPQLKKHLSASDLAHLSEQLEEVVLH